MATQVQKCPRPHLKLHTSKGSTPRRTPTAYDVELELAIQRLTDFLRELGPEAGVTVANSFERRMRDYVDRGYFS